MVSASLTNFSQRWQWWWEEEEKLLGSKSLVWDCPVFSLGGLQACSADHGWETLLSVDSGSLHGSPELEACPRGPALPWSERHHRHAGQLPAALRGKWRKGILKATWGIQTQRWSPRGKADLRGARRLVLGVESLDWKGYGRPQPGREVESLILDTPGLLLGCLFFQGRAAWQDGDRKGRI